MGFLEKFNLGVWNIGIIEDCASNVIKNSKDIQIKWLRHKYKDRFFADPFLYRTDEKNYYILVEEFPFYKNVGYISLLTIDKKTMMLIKKEKVIEKECHLSYPFVYNQKVIPEAYRSNQCMAYTLQNGKAEETEKIADFGLIDQTFLQYDGKEWIFATDKDNPLYGLKIFYREFGEKKWNAHSKNPVCEDIRSARPGGHFFQIGKELYRPVQDSEKLYGHRIRIMRVDELTVNTYQETEVAVISSKDNPPYSLGFHTFNVEEGFIVVDGYREYRSFLMKPLCLKLPKLMEKLGERK